MASEETLFAPHEIGTPKIEGEPYHFFRQWDREKRVPKYWLVRDGLQTTELLEKTGGSNPVWHRNGRRLGVNVSALLTSMEREYRVGKDGLSALAGDKGAAAVSEEIKGAETTEHVAEQKPVQRKSMMKGLNLVHYRSKETTIIFSGHGRSRACLGLTFMSAALRVASQRRSTKMLPTHGKTPAAGISAQPFPCC